MQFPFEPYRQELFLEEEILKKSQVNYHWMNQRRTVRDIDSVPIPKEVIEQLLLSAGTAPSGAHKQPWTFCAISSQELKSQIREAAEQEEKESYQGRMSEEWLKDLAPLGTDWEKPFLTEAPWIVVVFRKAYDWDEKGNKTNTYYSQESVGIACGFLIDAIHHAGLVTLTHTPSPMGFLTKILNRPENERPFLLLPIGYPKLDAKVPVLKRKSLSEIAVFYE